MTQNTRLFKKTLLAVTVAMASGQAMAAGFQLNAQSATGIGRAFAGDAVIADNVSVNAVTQQQWLYLTKWNCR